MGIDVAEMNGIAVKRKPFANTNRGGRGGDWNSRGTNKGVITKKNVVQIQVISKEPEDSTLLPPRGSSPLGSGGENQKGPICGQGGCVIPAASGIISALERGQNQKWPTCGQGRYITPAASGIPSASEQGAKSEVGHLWARWLRNSCQGTMQCTRRRKTKSDVHTAHNDECVVSAMTESMRITSTMVMEKDDYQHVIRKKRIHVALMHPTANKV